MRSVCFADSVLVRLASSCVEDGRNGDSMKTPRNFGYAALLAATIFNYAPSVASAEEPSRGRFKLAHEVRWENAVVPAGEYSFSYDPDSISPILTITKMDGTRASFMLMVPAKDESSPKDSNALVLASTPTGSYVSALKLAESGVTLYFWMPRATEKQIAKALPTVAGSGK